MDRATAEVATSAGVLEARVLAAVAALPGRPVPNDMLLAAGRDAGVSSEVMDSVLCDLRRARVGDRVSDRLRYAAAQFKIALREDARGCGWSRTWYTVVLPDAVGRATRNAFEIAVRETGGAFANSSMAVFARPWTDDVFRVLDTTGLSDRVVLSSGDILQRGVHDPRQLAARLWDLASLGDAYRNFVAAEREAIDASAVLRSLAHFWRCFDQDPVLPPELVPRPWPGREARAIVVANVRQLRTPDALARILTTRLAIPPATSRW